MSTGERSSAGSLGDRLKAYNKPAQKKNPKDLVHFESALKHFNSHPLSAESLELPDRVALNFLRDENKNRLLFFDLESTGLGSAEHVYPFLIGYAAPKGDGAELTTLFAATPAGEEDILRAFIVAAHNAVLVSFNGKSFDLPLIMRRAAKYNLKHNLGTLPHVDLFHLIRRIYPEKPARLIDAETRLLGFTRTGDLGGAEVAQAYFELVRFENTKLKDKILSHNQWDVLTLISLMQRVAAAFDLARAGNTTWAYKIHRDKSAGRTQQKVLLQQTDRALDARDYYALAKIYRFEKNLRRAVRYFIASYRAGYALAVVDAVRSLARLKKPKLTAVVARYALAREDERIQKHLFRYG
jgi:uncharacterized protein